MLNSSFRSEISAWPSYKSMTAPRAVAGGGAKQKGWSARSHPGITKLSVRKTVSRASLGLAVFALVRKVWAN